jgi:hypothetical protein
VKGHDVNQLKYTFFKHFELIDILKILLGPMQKNKFGSPAYTIVLNWKSRLNDIRIYIQNMSDTKSEIHPIGPHVAT